MRARGRRGEDAAVIFLQQNGLSVIARNYHCRFGEIDIIAQDGDVLVFVEVRMRSSNNFGGAAASITAAKRGKLLRTARHYLSGLACMPACRFDAVLIGDGGAPAEWLKDAFGE